MDLSGLGKWIFFVGLGVAGLGLVVWLAGRSGLPLGKFPGDVRVERGGFSFYLPIATAIVLSIVLTIILNVVTRLFRK